MFAWYGYKFINIHQRTKTVRLTTRILIPYKFINIHQRTKTSASDGMLICEYKFINIHQRTKTYALETTDADSISLSISIREPKLIARR